MSALLSIVMPAHNEADWLAASVRDVAAGLRERQQRFEIIVVENGSSDGTEAVADALAPDVPELRTLSLPNADYGAALRHGFLAAKGDVVVNFDVDYYDLEFVDRALPLLAEPGGPALVVATKRGAGAVDTRGAGRRLVTGVFSTVLRVGFGLRVSDTHGMKAMRVDALRPLVDRCRLGRDLFDTELIIRAERDGQRAAELPVVVAERRPSRSPIVRRAARTVGGLVHLWAVLRRDRRH